MGHIRNKVLFFTTSPRTPVKMIPEIKLLVEKFNGCVWNEATQEQFAIGLKDSDFFAGSTSASESALSARDRITRAPKALGFVDLKPKITITEAGTSFVYGKRPQEIFLRQLLKFQLPSPYHKEVEAIEGTFYVRPYLEILRLVRELEYITFDELKIFAVQLTDYRNFDQIKSKIIAFRFERERNKGTYKKFVNDVLTNVIIEIHDDRINKGKIKTRESAEVSLKKFINTQRNNMRDYADACFRYLRYTELISISHKSRTISFSPEKLLEVDHILSTVERKPVYVDDLTAYKAHLFSASIPELYGDIKDNILDSLMRLGTFTKLELIDQNLEDLKNLRDQIINERKEAVIIEQVNKIKSYELYSDIIKTYSEIMSKEIFDAPLMLEYNTWRAMTMLNGGDIKGNFKFDDIGQPLSTAQGNLPDIECDYGDYALSVEVTMQSGQRQYETEGEPVARHYGQLKKRTGKNTYCLFIAPTINLASLSHFFAINQIRIGYYGGKTQIIPLELRQFIQLVEASYNFQNNKNKQPNPQDIQMFLDGIIAQIENSDDELEWKQSIQTCVEQWLTK